MSNYKELPQVDQSFKGRLNRMFAYVRSREGSFIWLGERLTAIILMPFVLWFLVKSIQSTNLYVWDRELSGGFYYLMDHIFLQHNFVCFILMSVLSVHLRLGTHAIIEDYIHTENSKNLAFKLLDVTLILLLLNVITFLFF